MSEREIPLNPNPSSGGSPAIPQEEEEEDDIDEEVVAPPAATNGNNINDTVEDATAMLARTDIGGEDDDDNEEDDSEEDDDHDADAVAVADADDGEGEGPEEEGEEEGDEGEGRGIALDSTTQHEVAAAEEVQNENDDGEEDEEADAVAGLEAERDEEEDEEQDEDEVQDMLSMLPPKVVRRVEKLKELHAERDKILEEYLLARAQLERTFAERYKPLYEKRLDVISGKLDDEIDAAATAVAATAGEGKHRAPEEGEDKEKKEDVAQSPPEESEQPIITEDVEEDEEEEEHIIGIPQFWVCAMGHMEVVAELITERDVDCLEHLRDITCEEEEDGKGFTLRFHFGPNDYFHNEVLSKRYEIPNLLLDDEPILKNVTGTDIHWKNGRSLTYREVRKKQRSKSGKRAGQIRTIVKKERTDSFFHFFNPPKMPSMDDMDEEEADALEEAFDHDYDIAQAFRSHIIPKAVLWFTGEALEEDMEDLLEEEGLLDGEEDQTDNVASSLFPPPVQGGGENPECKQN